MMSFDGYECYYPDISTDQKIEEIEKATGKRIFIQIDLGDDIDADLQYAAMKQGKRVNYYYQGTALVGYRFVSYKKREDK